MLTNEEYSEKIAPYTKQLQALNDEAKTLAMKVIGKNLLKEDLCLCAALDRSIRLTDGFIPMIEFRNLTCAGALLRLQMDNCMRLFALFIANDRDEAVDCIINGGKFDKLKDKTGKQMQDWYLKEKLDAYDRMIEFRNLTCAGALLRLQMDNCMRLFALFIANDRDEAVDCIINGGKFDKLKDKTGKQMQDWYLKEKLDAYDRNFSNVYTQASGFIHFSNKAFYQSVHTQENYELFFQVGGEQPEKINSVLLQCTDAFIHYTELFHKLMNIVAESKADFDASYGGITVTHILSDN